MGIKRFIDYIRAMRKIDLLIEKGWNITYEIIDQEENGTKDVTGVNYTVSSYVRSPEMSPYGDSYLESYQASFNTLEEMYIWLADNIKER
ncbi:hypothetical protein [Liquorilactobacillus hordei]|uniref:hypothetical protein n=2 Tax=Liquorilactobacillus hordei TaxID=468911 RepID=UPI0007093629|nr:hypothetical protein [Liquorilactobacillus hordei]QYH51419.1 hypothetical protein G6O70_02490 [Liquorilactobacillus hordei DSM 19519]